MPPFKSAPPLEKPGTAAEIDNHLARLHGSDCLGVAGAKPEFGVAASSASE
jgi:hypothetical protein